MDPIKNPFSPGAGSPPPELAGRAPVLEQARILLGRVMIGKSEKSLMLTGLRGVGKTVLLNEVRRMAQESGYRTVLVEAHEEKALGPLIAAPLKAVFFELDRIAQTGDRVKRGLRVLRSFVGGLKVKLGELEIGLDIDPETGAADSGDIEIDLPNVFEALGEAAKEKQTAVAILIDEIQYLSQKELGAIIMAMHRMQQRQLPVVLLGAGLPVLPGLAGESKSYAERLFAFPDIGALSEADSNQAISEPATQEGVTLTAAALTETYRLTKGYPYFIQEWGYQMWNLAVSSPIDLALVQSAADSVVRRLDQNFFRVRFDRLTPGEKNFLRAMAQLGSGAIRSGDIANCLGVKVNSIGPVRSKLIKKGMIYSPAYGDMAFTVPLFDEFMKRAIPHFTAKE
ncbi:MAG: ATP-binding protein [Betaproteobacteria bacterium]|nr:ATP-binding protein [Betaproteobacteria bacterium]